MATIYMQPTAQSPSADGSYGDPYDTGSMATAETAAGAGGTIIFKDGAYTETTLVIASAIITAMAYKAENSGGVTITVSNKLTFGNGSLAAAVTYQGLNFVNSSTSTSADRIVFDSDTTTRHFFTQCSFKACVFMEAWGTTSKCYVKFMQCVFELSLTSGAAFHWFDQRNNNGAVEFDGCTILNIPGAGRGGNIFNKLDLTFTNTIVYDGDSLSTGFEAAGATPILHPKNCLVKADGTDLFPNANNIALDPLFIDYEDADYRLRPSSPCIGGGLITNQSRLESAHPTGKWFDSNAAGGGDGSYATPYNVIEEAIDSFTSALAVVFVKEGDHILKTGFNGVNTGSVDFAQAHTEGIKVIGESKKSRFLTGTNLSGWAMWATTWTGAPYSPPNSMLSPMFFEDIVVLFNEVGASVARGWLCGKSITMTNCIIDQVDGAFITGNLFYSSPSPDIVLTDCIIAASMCKSAQVQLIPRAGLITAKRCTFADLGRAVITLRPSQMMFNPLGTFTDCIFYSSVLMDDNPGFFNGAAQQSAQFTRCSVFNAASNSNFSDFVSQLADQYRVDCVLTDPKLVNATVTASSLQLRPSSPCIGFNKAPALPSTSYVAPTAQGAGDGTSPEDAWAYADLASAETQAGVGGTVYFTDGIYSVTTATWDTDGLTYASLNSQKAVIDGTVAAQGNAVRVLTQGDYSNSVGVTVQGFKFIDFKIFHELNNGTSAINEVKSCNFVNSTYLDYGGLGIMQGNWGSTVVKLTHCSLTCLIYSGSKIFYDANAWQINNCSFSICFHASSTAADSNLAASATKNDSIFYSTDSGKVNGASVSSSSTRCCWYNWGSSTSGGTDNIFADPRFINPSSNLQLRPSSPLIGRSPS